MAPMVRQLEELLGGGRGARGADNAIFAPFYTKKRSFCQDRLGTNIGNAEKMGGRFLSAGGGGLGVVDEGEVASIVTRICQE